MLATLLSVAALLSGVGILLMGNGLLSTLLSLRTAIEGYSPELTGLVMSAYFAGLVAGSLYCSKVVHRIGHIRAFAAFASILSVTALIHGFVVTAPVWALLRALSGFCVAGVFMVSESWLNTRATNQNRGQVLSFYMITAYLSIGLGQFLLNLSDPERIELFAVVSILFSLALVPVALTQAAAPRIERPSGLGLRRLYALTPLGVVGCLASGMLTGALYGMGPIFASGIGLSVSGVSAFMGLVVLGGLFMSWPVGWLSDRFDRRTVMAAVSLATVLIALAIPAAAGRPEPLLLVLAGLYGGLSFPLYSLSVAHANDYVEPQDLVQASSGLLVAYGVGASLGPIAAAAVMGALGPHGLFVYSAVISAAFGLIVLYRMRRREPLPLAEQGRHVVLPRTTPEAAYLDPRGAPEQSDFDFAIEAAEPPDEAGGGA
ncbi:MAG: MFS transporter [Alphaproteobacteria bacterium]|nr:MFS transporter [Alphaproteobacteria bacterium]